MAFGPISLAESLLLLVAALATKVLPWVAIGVGGIIALRKRLRLAGGTILAASILNILGSGAYFLLSRLASTSTVVALSTPFFGLAGIGVPADLLLAIGIVTLARSAPRSNPPSR